MKTNKINVVLSLNKSVVTTYGDTFSNINTSRWIWTIVKDPKKIESHPAHCPQTTAGTATGAGGGTGGGTFTAGQGTTGYSANSGCC